MEIKTHHQVCECHQLKGVAAQTSWVVNTDFETIVEVNDRAVVRVWYQHWFNQRDWDVSKMREFTVELNDNMMYDDVWKGSY